MFKQAHLIPSDAMDRRVYLWQYGDFGAPLLVFPSAAGMAHEWEAQGMVDALAPLIHAGKLKLYCTESNVAEAWTRKEADPAWRIGRHRAFERYVVEDLVPFIRQDCRTPGIKIAVSGCSLGAFYSVNFALKYSELFDYALCMSGRYDMVRFLEGFNNDDVYFNNPMAYVPNLHGEHLARIRRNTEIVLVVGQGKWEEGNTEETRQLGSMLEQKGIRCYTDIWGKDVNHEWPWWRKQVVHHLGKRLL